MIDTFHKLSGGVALLFVVMGAMLGACNTIEGAGKDIEAAGEAIEEEAKEEK